jgi:hypothetical protein
MPTWWRDLRGLLFGRIHSRVTRGGLLFTLAIVLVGAAAVVSANNLLFLILATMFSTLLISGLISRLCLAGLELDFLVPEHACAGRTIPARLYVRNLKGWMPSFSVRVVALRESNAAVRIPALYFPAIPGRTLLEETVQVRFERRGAYTQNTFAFSTRFPFGFLEKTARVTLRQEVLVYPSIDPQPGFEDLLAGIAGEIESHYRGLGRDFYRIRPYEAFESSRHVDWKATAHTGDLQVREFAREHERRLEIFLDRAAEPAGREWFERAVNCCAFLCWRLAVDEGADIHFRSQDFDFRLPEEGDIYTILKFLALVELQAGRAPEPPADDTSFQIVLTSAPGAFREAGWLSARILDPASLAPPAGGAAGSAGAGEDLDHDRGVDRHRSAGQPRGDGPPRDPRDAGHQPR